MYSHVLHLLPACINCTEKMPPLSPTEAKGPLYSEHEQVHSCYECKHCDLQTPHPFTERDSRSPAPQQHGRCSGREGSSQAEEAPQARGAAESRRCPRLAGTPSARCGRRPGPARPEPPGECGGGARHMAGARAGRGPAGSEFWFLG